MWTLPLLIVGTAVLLAVPLGLYMAWIFDSRYRAPAWLRWFEQRLDTGPQSWKRYAVALLLFNVAIFVVGFAILALQARGFRPLEAVITVLVGVIVIGWWRRPRRGLLAAR